MSATVTSRAGLEQVADDVSADVSRALHGDADAVEARRPTPASSIAARIPQKTPHAVIGEGSPEPPFSTGRPVMWRVSRGDDLGVGGRRADVLGRQVAAAERLDEPPQRPEQELALLRPRIADHHGLAAAERQPGAEFL